MKFSHFAFVAVIGSIGAGTVQAQDWTGAYVGGHVGYGFGAVTDSLECTGFPLDDKLGSISFISGEGVGCDLSDESGPVVAITALENDDSLFAPWNTTDDLSDLNGFLAGAQAGYRQQIGVVVIGAELAGAVSSISDTGTTELFLLGIGGEPATYTGSVDVNWLTTVTGKVGYVLNDDLLISAVGGLALAGTEFSSSAGYSDDRVAQGFTIGAQVDYRLAENVSVFGAYNYVGLPNVEYQGASAGGLIANFHEYDIGLHQVKAGINYNFN